MYTQCANYIQGRIIAFFPGINIEKKFRGNYTVCVFKLGKTFPRVQITAYFFTY